MNLYIIAALPPAVLIIFGLCIKYFRMYWLITGLRLIAPGEMKKSETRNIFKYAGNMCFIFAGIIYLFSVSFIYAIYVLAILAIILFLVVLYFTFKKINKLKKNSESSSVVIRKKGRTMVISVLIVLLIVAAGSGLIIYQTAGPITYTAYNDRVRVGGWFGDTLYYKDITHKDILDKLPKVNSKTDGISYGSVMKGGFDVEGYGDSDLQVKTNNPAFLAFETTGKTLIMSFDNKNDLYQLLVEIESYTK